MGVEVAVLREDRDSSEKTTLVWIPSTTSVAFGYKTFSVEDAIDVLSGLIPSKSGWP